MGRARGFKITCSPTAMSWLRERLTIVGTKGHFDKGRASAPGRVQGASGVRLYAGILCPTLAVPLDLKAEPLSG